MAISQVLRHPVPGAITVPQFVASFQRIWRESSLSRGPTTRGPRLPSRLGLAVSGGADSMALAYLCREWEKTSSSSSSSSSSASSIASTGRAEEPPPPVSVTAFIVDHKAREESSREAALVAGWLREMGIKTQILPLDWSTLNPTELSAFETHARRLRFQALGHACRAAGIDALLTGHHRDDNVETTLWRLCTGARGPGLCGIPAVTGIPECHGMFGVVGSRQVEGLRSSLGPQRMSGAGGIGAVPAATSTLPILRPLLPFPKSHCLATCAAHRIPFVSDPTNFDPTLTPRNAIRSLLGKGVLPRALREESVLRLIEASQRLVRRSWEASDQLLQKCRVERFVPETGVAVVRFPGLPSVAAAAAAAAADSKEQCVPQIQALTLRRITELVSPFPDNHFALRGFERFTQRVFLSEQQQQQPPQQPQSFTLGGVMFQPLCAETEEGTSTGKQTTGTLNQHAWLLSRQPYMKNRLPVLDVDLDMSPMQVTSHAAADTDRCTSDWHLWDNRYWFRMSWKSPNRHPSPHAHHHGSRSRDPNVHPTTTTSERKKKTQAEETLHLRIRPLQKRDLKHLRRAVLDPVSDSSFVPDSPFHHPQTRSRDTNLTHQFEAESEIPTTTTTQQYPDSQSTQQVNNQHPNPGTSATPNTPLTLSHLLAHASPGPTRFTVPMLVLMRRRRRLRPGDGDGDRMSSASDGGVYTTPASASTSASTQAEEAEQHLQEEGEEEEIPLALPTLNTWLLTSRPFRQTHAQARTPAAETGAEAEAEAASIIQTLTWEWRYKMVDRAGTLRKMGWE
ncbi:tRNA lysidine(34) synthetase [Aspergillus saccharolyticus JOP 1030-1]|uniref:tRNA(Ile)-lysidine synthetase n=1 Tax=Aspergillus saccharolyticus JOP 1030-1 TaxID=1450539 RepID=A0A318ZE36_9EURO|nr:hypothetical protein BP01DRAFT_392481 [Aspergillus saccharolyticus JOP 1030-1]PYH44544.1 hypothetical protein BP01DRAFT_392481 [Aspergillus saccharolyticus JOP 1030-1]